MKRLSGSSDSNLYNINLFSGLSDTRAQPRVFFRTWLRLHNCKPCDFLFMHSDQLSYRPKQEERVYISANGRNRSGKRKQHIKLPSS